MSPQTQLHSGWEWNWPHCGVIGVFVDQSLKTVRDVAAQVGLTGVQLHGKESVEDCQILRDEGLTVWKSITVRQDMTVDQLLTVAETYAPAVDGLLLDAAPPKHAGATVTGGHGVSFDWSLMSAFLTRYQAAQLKPQLWVAGGFRPDNVDAFVRACGQDVLPAGIDVSSGVETDGRKSSDKIQQMIQVVSNL